MFNAVLVQATCNMIQGNELYVDYDEKDGFR